METQGIFQKSYTVFWRNEKKIARIFLCIERSIITINSLLTAVGQNP